jgi:hypothetical protein
MLQALLTSVQTILGEHFIGMYLDGSLTSDAFDQASDIDFIVVTDEEVSGELFGALQAMHDRLAMLDSPWAIQLEGSYLSQRAFRRYDPANALHPNIERGPSERLKMLQHDAAFIIHQWIVRERGITLAGPAPQSLIDPVSPTDLQKAMVSMLPDWLAHLGRDPTPLQGRGYQSYVVLSLCRVLYTLHFGAVASKPAAARWVQESLGEPWVLLIERALAGRHDPGLETTAEDVNGTLALVRYTQERSQQFVLPTPPI